MAISKILNMKDCGGHFHGKHLKRSLDYVMNPEKTQDGRLIGAINCQVDSAFEQMKATKRKFGKVDKRQGYHIILSFKEDEVNSDTAFEITRRFVEEYLGKSYEAEAGKKLAKKTAKKAAKDTAKTVAKETAKETAKTTAKVATKTATKAAATAAGTAVAPGVGTAIGMAAGYAAGVSIEVKDESC